MRPLREHAEEALATLRGTLFWFAVLGLPFLALGVIALQRIRVHGASGEFLIGHVPIPKWMGAGASNLDVFLMCAVAVLVLALSLMLRYFHHRSMLRFLRERGVRDLNKDGSVDAYTDRFLDDL